MVRLGIAGIGAIAGTYIDIIASGKVSNVCLAALCSRNQDRLQALTKQYNLQAALFSGYSDMIASGKIDAVLICTPHGLHPVMARQAFEAGLHVLLEKPVGIYEQDVSQALQALAKDDGLVCGVLYNRRASEVFRFVKNYVSSGNIGEMVRSTWIITNLYRTAAYYKSGTWRGSWEQEGGGILMTQASHQLDLMQWICGMPSEIFARISTVNREIEVENEAELLLTYPNGAHGHFITSAHESPGTNILEICGTKGKISVAGDRDVRVHRLDADERQFSRDCPNPFEQVPGTAETIVLSESDNAAQHAATIQNFIDTILGKAEVLCTLRDGLNSLQMIHGTYLSHWLKKSVALPAAESAFREQLMHRLSDRSSC